jgi:YVTN family beta-propeller protein
MVSTRSHRTSRTLPARRPGLVAALRRAPVATLAALMALAGCRGQDFPDYPRDYREYAYVTNSGSNSVTVLDLIRLRQDRVLAVGRNPAGIAGNPPRKEVYAVNSGSDSVSVIDAVQGEVVATIPVHHRPYFIDVSPDGARAYVANSGSNDVSIIDLAHRRVLATVGVGESPGLARISGDGRTVVVSNRQSGSVTLIDAGSDRVRAIFPGCPGATDVRILPDSSKAFIACSAGRQIMVLGLARSNGLPSERADRMLCLLDVGRAPVSLALKPDGGEIFSVNFDTNSISEIETATSEVASSYPIGLHPSQGLVSADNSLLWVSDFSGAAVSIYSIDDGKLIGTVRVGEGPDAMAMTREGHLLLVLDSVSSDAALIRTRHSSTESPSLFTLLPTGSHPSGVAIEAFRLHGG